MLEKPPSNKPSRLEKKFSLIEHRIQKAAPITAEYLKSLFLDPRFGDALKEAQRLFLKSERRETGFAVMKDSESDKTWYSPTRGSTRLGTNVLDTGLLLRTLSKKISRQERVYPVAIASFHFHTDAHETFPVTPSAEHGDSDLDSLSRWRIENRGKVGFDIIPLEIIAAPALHGNEMYLLVCRESELYTLLDKPAMQDELQRTLYEAQTEDEVTEALRHYQYKAEVFKTVDGRISEQDIERLTPFAYVPRYVSDDEFIGDVAL